LYKPQYKIFLNTLRVDVFKKQFVLQIDKLADVV